MPDLTCAELARRYGVARSTVMRALRSAAEAYGRDLSLPRPPLPVNPGEPQLRYRSEDVDAWWPARPGVGRPRVRGSENPH